MRARGGGTEDTEHWLAGDIYRNPDEQCLNGPHKRHLHKTFKTVAQTRSHAQQHLCYILQTFAPFVPGLL